ncbi:MAG: hypothetical protein MUO31_07095 [Thermodesulfovibrionales bacterium]|nr:hypothetical protein [Thermodesulfovibrionales bacterium]
MRCPDNKVDHRIFPVMIGSLIDLSIRSEVDSKHMGGFIIEGELCVINNYLMNNVNTMSIQRGRGNLHDVLRWNIDSETHCYRLRFDGTAVEMVEFPKVSRQPRKREKHTDWKTKKEIPKGNVIEAWTAMLNSMSQFTASMDDYMDLFGAICKTFPSIDSLSNKVLITAPVILDKVREYVLTLVTRRKGIFTSGNMYFVLSKQSNKSMVYTKSANLSITKKFQSVYMPIDGQKQDKVIDFVSSTKRPVPNSQTMNSGQLLMPPDAEGFLDPLSCKEMKDAGISLNLAQYVIISRAIPIQNIYDHMQLKHKTGNEYHLVINGFLTGIWVPFDFQSFIEYKRALVYVTFSKYENRTKYLYAVSADNIPLKWYSTYQVFVSPYENQLFNEQLGNSYINNRHKFCQNINKMNDFFINTPSTKNTVTINNFKGSCNHVQTNLDKVAFLASVGYNSAIIHPPEIIEASRVATPYSGLRVDGDYTQLSLLSDDPMDAEIKKICMEMHNDPILPILKTKHDEFVKFDKYPERTKRVVPEILNALTPVDVVLRCTPAGCSRRKMTTHDFGPDETYLKRLDALFEELEYRPAYQIKLISGFCAIGPTVEDGFILDSDVVKYGPKKCLSTSLNVNITRETSKISQRNIVKWKLFYRPKNRIVRSNGNDVIEFGTLLSLQKLYLSRNRRICIDECQIGDQWSYSITYPIVITDASTQYHVSSRLQPGGYINIAYHYFVPLGVGSKMCNRFGQKGEIAEIRDLSDMGGYDVHGNWRKPQLLMNVTSTIGRLASGQVKEMTSHPGRIITPSGGIMAPSDYTVHAIDASTKLNVSSVRNDAMTNQNGFDCNQMSTTALLMDRQNVSGGEPAHIDHLANLIATRNIKLTTF